MFQCFFFKPNCDFILVNVYFMTEKKIKINFFIEGRNHQNIDKEWYREDKLMVSAFLLSSINDGLIVFPWMYISRSFIFILIWVFIIVAVNFHFLFNIFYSFYFIMYSLIIIFYHISNEIFYVYFYAYSLIIILVHYIFMPTAVKGVGAKWLTPRYYYSTFILF
jgi:hypothetical protein